MFNAKPERPSRSVGAQTRERPTIRRLGPGQKGRAGRTILLDSELVTESVTDTALRRHEEQRFEKQVRQQERTGPAQGG